MSDTLLAILLIAVGLFSAAGGVLDWDWFMTNRRAARFVRLISRTGARVFYVVLGIVLAVVGVLMLTGAFGS